MEVDEEGGHLEPVLTQGIKDAIMLVSDLSLPA